MIDFIREINYSDGTSNHSINIQKLKEWAEKKDRQIEELKAMVERLAFKDIVNDKEIDNIHLNWKE